MNPILRILLLILLSPVLLCSAGILLCAVVAVLTIGNLLALIEAAVDNKPIKWFTLKDF